MRSETTATKDHAKKKEAAPVNRYGIPPCPECGRDDFKAKTVWGMHRRTAHGILGSAKSAVDRRNRLAKEEGKPTSFKDSNKDPATQTFTCDQCGSSFPRPQDLGRHKQAKHGIVGTSPAVLAKRRQRDGNTTQGSLQCDQCDFQTRYPQVLGRHKQQMHGVQGISTAAIARRRQIDANHTSLQVNRRDHGAISNGTNHSDAQSTAQHQSELVVAIAVGEVKGLLRAIAEQEGVPTLQLTYRVAEFIRGTTRRN